MNEITVRFSNFGMKSLSLKLIDVEIANFKFTAIISKNSRFVDFLNGNQKARGKIQHQKKMLYKSLRI